MKNKLSLSQKEELITGEVTLTAVMAICAIAIASVIIYKMFMSTEGSSTVPGGWKFTWK